MAQSTVTVLTDDLDGSTGDETIRFTWQGEPLEIDLSSANAEKFKDAVRPYVTAARKVTEFRKSTPAKQSKVKTSGPTPEQEETKRIREWAKENGLEVSDRGRISQTIRDLYAAEH